MFFLASAHLGTLAHLTSEVRLLIKITGTQHPGRVITTEAIAALIGRAWPLSHTPINIMGGFRKSGTFPLNPGVIDDRQVAPSLAVSSSLHGQDVRSSPSSDNSSPCSPGFAKTDQEALFRKRYEEGYDLPDPVYNHWLSINYPEGSKSSASLTTHISCMHRH